MLIILKRNHKQKYEYENLVLSFAILTSVLSFAQQREDRNLRGTKKEAQRYKIWRNKT